MGAVVSGVGHGVRLGQMKPFLTENDLVSLCTLSARNGNNREKLEKFGVHKAPPAYLGSFLGVQTPSAFLLHSGRREGHW